MELLLLIGGAAAGAAAMRRGAGAGHFDLRPSAAPGALQ